MMKGHSIEAQTEKCLRYAKAHGLQLGEETNCGVAGVFVDGGQSATKKVKLTDRPGGRALIVALRPGDHLICTSPHRLFRSLLQSESQVNEWEEAKVRLHFIDAKIRSDTPNGRLMLQMLFSVAEWRRRVLSARTREGILFGKKAKITQPTVVEKIEEALEKRIDPNDPLTTVMVNSIYDRLNPPPQTFSGTIRAYVRVSTTDQNVEVQEAALKQWIEAGDFGDKPPKVEWYIDHGHSAFSKMLKHRPKGKQLCKDLKKGDIVLALRADRVVRSMKDIAAVIELLDERQATLVMIDCDLRTDTPFGRLMVTLLAFVAQMESVENDLSSNSSVAERIRTRGADPGAVPILLQPPDTITKRIAKGLGYCHARRFVPYDVFARAVVLYYCEYQKTGKDTSRLANRYICHEMGWPRFYIPPCNVLNPTDMTLPLKERKNEQCHEYAARLIDAGFGEHPMTQYMSQDMFRLRPFVGWMIEHGQSPKTLKKTAPKFFALMEQIDVNSDTVQTYHKMLKLYYQSYLKGELDIPAQVRQETAKRKN